MLKYLMVNLKRVKTSTTFLILTLAMGLPLLLTACGVQTNQPGDTPVLTPKTGVKKNVLVLYAYQSDLISSELSAKAIREEFSQVSDLQADLYFEYLDMGRFSDQAYQDRLIALLNQKYMQKSIDLVIVANQMMIQWWPENRAKILPETPVVFFDIDSRNVSGLQLPPDFTGVSGFVDYVQSVKWYLGARPTVNEIVIVHGMGPVDLNKNNSFPVELLKQEFTGKLKVTDISTLPLAEIKNHVASLPPTSILVYHLMFEDADGKSQSPINILRELNAVSSVPIISAFDQFVGEGTVGGYMYSIDRQARDAVGIALRILRGEKPADIPVSIDQSNVFMFDHLALQRYGIPLSALPPGAVIKNRQYSFWELYQPQIIAAIFVGVVLLVMVIFLLLFSNRLVRARLALINLNASLETQVEKRTIDLRETNSSLEEEITERKQIENALRESEERYRILFEDAIEGIVQSTPQGKYINVNQSYARIFGYDSPDEMVDQVTNVGVQIYAHPEDRARLLGLLASSDRVENFEAEGICKDGRLMWCSFNVNAIRNVQGELLRLDSRLVDITQRKLAEISLQQKTEELDRFFNIALDLLCIADTDGNFRRLNQAWETTLGYPLVELENSSFLNYVHPDDMQVTLDSMSELSEQKPVINFVNRYRCKDGSYRWIEWRTAPLGKQIYAAARDITVRKQAEEKLQNAQAGLETRVKERTAELEAANHELEAFSYSISHDLRTPLRALDGFSGILLADYQDKLDEQAQDYLMRIRKASRHMWQLTEDLLALAHVTRMEFTPGRVNLSSLARQAAAEFQSLDPHRKVKIEITPDMAAYGDPNLLKIVYENLLNNAYKFTGQREQAQIQVGVMEQAGEMIYFISDNGSGFDMAYAGKLFTPFQRLHKTDEFPGTGIGLVTVKRIINRHGGRIWPDAELNRGATFYFTLGKGQQINE